MHLTVKSTPGNLSGMHPSWPIFKIGNHSCLDISILKDSATLLREVTEEQEEEDEKKSEGAVKTKAAAVKER